MYIYTHTHRGKGDSACLWSFWGMLTAICIGLGFLKILKYNRTVVFNVRQHLADLSCTVLLFCTGSSSRLADALGFFPPGWISQFSCQHFCSLMTGFLSWYPLLMIMASQVYYSTVLIPTAYIPEWGKNQEGWITERQNVWVWISLQDQLCLPWLINLWDLNSR